MSFKTMKTEDVLKALEGHQNVLKPAVEAHQAYFRRIQCVACGGECMPILNSKKLFREGDILPNYLAKCKTCGVEFEPYTGIQVSAPGR